MTNLPFAIERGHKARAYVTNLLNKYVQGTCLLSSSDPPGVPGTRFTTAAAAATVFGQHSGKFANGNGSAAVCEAVLCRPHAARRKLRSEFDTS